MQYKVSWKKGKPFLCPKIIEQAHESYQPLDKDIYTIHNTIQAKIVESQEEIIMQAIREIGGDTFCEITIDRNKVLEALNDYKNKGKQTPCDLCVYKDSPLDGNICKWCPAKRKEEK